MKTVTVTVTLSLPTTVTLTVDVPDEEDVTTAEVTAVRRDVVQPSLCPSDVNETLEICGFECLDEPVLKALEA